VCAPGGAYRTLPSYADTAAPPITRSCGACCFDAVCCLAAAAMGGAYLTLLNTIANMGVILPKSPLFAAMDLLTVSRCRDGDGAVVAGLTCPKKLKELTASNACTDAGMLADMQSRHREHRTQNLMPQSAEQRRLQLWRQCAADLTTSWQTQLCCIWLHSGLRVVL